MRATDLFKQDNLEQINAFAKKYRKSINPPYNRRSIISVFVTVFILIILPFTVIAGNQARQLIGKAATGVTYYVDCSGGNDANSGMSESSAWKTLSKASSATLSAGDSLLLKRGCTWSETLNVSWIGTVSDNVLVGAYGTGSNLPTIERNTNGANVLVTGSYITFENLLIRADPPSTEAGCENNPKGNTQGFSFQSGSHDNTVRNSVITGHYAGVFVRSGSHRNKILNNQFTANIMMSPLDSSADNDAGAFGVLLWGDDNEIANNNFIDHNACSYDYGRDGSAVEVYGGQRNNIHHNTAKNNAAFSELGNSRSSDNTFAYNTFESSIDTSIFLVTRGGGTWGPIARTKVYNNTIILTGASSQGFVCHAGCSNDIFTFKNNIVWSEGKAGYSDAGFDESNNIYWKTGGNPILQFTKDASSLIADPKFVDRANSDFHLQSGSPAIDAGTNESVTAGYTKDLDGKTVPIGSSPDMGAYEYDSGTPPPQTSVTIAAVGDMNPTGNTSTSSYSSKNGAAISAALADGTVDAFLGLGDFQYNTAYCYDYVNYWDRLWGGTKSKLYWVSAPNHDWEPGRNEDLDNFMNGQCSGDTTKSAINEQRGFIENGEAYSFDLGNWHFVMLSTALWRYDEARANQTTTWLDNDLATAKAAGKHLAVAYHDPYFTSKTSSHDRTWKVKSWIDIMDKWDVRLTLSASQHNYERSCPVTKDDICVADNDPNGMTAFQVSTGGIGLRSFADSPSFIVKRFTGTWGWLQLTLNSDGSFSWQFNPVEGSGTDSGFRVAPGGIPDNESPVVSITSPTNGATVSGSVNITATANDNVGVTKVEFLVDGSVKNTDNTSPYAYSWDSATVVNGPHTIVAKAYDAASNVGTSTAITVTTDNDTQTITFTPSADATIKSDSASTNFGSAASLEVDGTSVYDFLTKFNVSGIGSKSIASAKLRFYNVDPSDNGGSFYRVSDNSWSESTATWGNAPSADATPIGTLGSVTAGNWYEVNVASVVAGDGTYSFRTKSTSSNGADYSSKEGSFAPELVITVSDTGTKPGDINGDGVVNIFDASILASRWGTNDPDADLNGNGVVDIFDASILASNWEG